MDWLDVIPTLLSAVASIAAAVAAFVSLRISKRSISIAESSALAIHHNSASLVYSNVVTNLGEICRDLSEFSLKLSIEWPKELESKDHYNLGGKNPRPLRHVISDGGNMLANYALNNQLWGSSGNQAIFSVIRHGVSGLNDSEYKRLLKKADGEYQSFEGIFGIPSKSSSIVSASAFRWVCYQLIKRVKVEDWKNIWEVAWFENGWLYNYQVEYLKIRPILQQAKISLKTEKLKLAHTSFPLDYNTELSRKYDEILKVIDYLLNDCNSELLDDYKDWNFNEELSQLVICSMAMVCFTKMQLDIIDINNYGLLDISS
ncbi:hypothetical protein [Aliivibrio fischeri]|uniref:hypothetical protein n=1 Tax=Aliivibrio fischeri TaxID=668 RepID=UPI001ADDA056|nr:hypothetical protein [Aliivibrio fischeri]